MEKKRISDLIKDVTDLQRKEKTVEISSGLAIKLATLNYGEQLNCLADIKMSENANNLEFIHMAQIATLSRATKEVNGQSYTVEEFKELYKTMQFVVVQHIYDQYADMIKGQQAALEELKKK